MLDKINNTYILLDIIQFLSLKDIQNVIFLNK
jgi:hypothetical protein